MAAPSFPLSNLAGMAMYVLPESEDILADWDPADLVSASATFFSSFAVVGFANTLPHPSPTATPPPPLVTTNQSPRPAASPRAGRNPTSPRATQSPTTTFDPEPIHNGSTPIIKNPVNQSSVIDLTGDSDDSDKANTPETAAKGDEALKKFHQGLKRKNFDWLKDPKNTVPATKKAKVSQTPVKGSVAPMPKKKSTKGLVAPMPGAKSTKNKGSDEKEFRPLSWYEEWQLGMTQTRVRGSLGGIFALKEPEGPIVTELETYNPANEILANLLETEGSTTQENLHQKKGNKKNTTKKSAEDVYHPTDDDLARMVEEELAAGAEEPYNPSNDELAKMMEEELEAQTEDSE
ncbi:hypothetical protein N7532_006040 [Penicillium argentinense]|uniref:Uncharacterized protein n=1 Tax=Penicillium argentinense TaxID=1131581 RepID=A0A9W9FF57_9EURO|nr:uncharacterized protein N7532_006040 [Penicillium argentinense]KAJ5099039.1 hypothetical protein N7532_006040 [Penicillium argentinense]